MDVAWLATSSHLLPEFILPLGAGNLHEKEAIAEEKPYGKIMRERMKS